MRSGILVLCLGALLVGCTSDSDKPATSPIHNPGLSQSESTTPVAPTADPIDPGDAERVKVHMRLLVPSGPETKALSAFIAAHARSIRVGQPTGSLKRVASAAEYQRQLGVIRYARENGLTVPSDPNVAVVDRRELDSGGVALGVCLWLPSTEYVDQITGNPPSGPVPERWMPAVATVTQQTKTWFVDKLAAPEQRNAPICGGLT